MDKLQRGASTKIFLAAWENADCQIKVEHLSHGVRITWTDDPLDFITLAPKAVGQLIERLSEPRVKGNI